MAIRKATAQLCLLIEAITPEIQRVKQSIENVFDAELRIYTGSEGEMLCVIVFLSNSLKVDYDWCPNLKSC